MVLVPILGLHVLHISGEIQFAILTQSRISCIHMSNLRIKDISVTQMVGNHF